MFTYYCVSVREKVILTLFKSAKKKNMSGTTTTMPEDLKATGAQLRSSSRLFLLYQGYICVVVVAVAH